MPRVNFTCALVSLLILTTRAAIAQDEVSLFDAEGRAVAYVATDDGLSIFLWGGKPVAYLTADNSRGFHVYGFNGKHLGWLAEGVVWDQDGAASCAAREAMQAVQLEPIKGIKEIKPIKAVKDIPPVRPVFSRSFGDTACELLLASGGD